MNHTLRQIRQYQPLDKVIIHSVGMGIYQASVEKDGDEYYLVESDGTPLKANNIIDLQRQLRPLIFAKMVLCHESPYDEMIGHQTQTSGSNRLEVPLGDNRLD